MKVVFQGNRLWCWTGQAPDLPEAALLLPEGLQVHRVPEGRAVPAGVQSLGANPV